MSKFKNITFDITGTILRLRKPAGQLYAEVGHKYGVIADPNKLNTNFKRVWAEMNKLHPNYGIYTGMKWENWWQKVVIFSFEETLDGNKYDKTVLLKVADDLIQLFRTKEGWALKEGSLDLLHYLHSKEDVNVGVISNFDTRLHHILQNMKIDKFFKFVTTSYESSYLKPDVNIFRYAEKLFEQGTQSKFNPNLALHIGDSPELDYFAALNAGWTAALINKEPKAILDKYHNVKLDMVFHDLYTFKQFLEESP